MLLCLLTTILDSTFAYELGTSNKINISLCVFLITSQVSYLFKKIFKVLKGKVSKAKNSKFFR